MPKKKNNQVARNSNIFTLLKEYKFLVIIITLVAAISNGTNIILPSLIARGIDAYNKGINDVSLIAWEFFATCVVVLIFAYLQSIAQTVGSERVARDLRAKLAGKISQHSYLYIEKIGPSKLLTNLTSDIDAVKSFVSQALPGTIASSVLIIGISFMLLRLNW